MSTDRGSATIWILGLAVMVLAATQLVVVRGSAVLARHRLANTADLAALAAAATIGTNRDGCAAARRIATANRAQLLDCVVQLDSSGRLGTCAIQLASAVTLPLAGRRTVRARAKAARLPPAAP
ncbi:MAG: Rv3654c family TadE-like protein [Jatrophihabitantaceae bacterium]